MRAAWMEFQEYVNVKFYHFHSMKILLQFMLKFYHIPLYSLESKSVKSVLEYRFYFFGIVMVFEHPVLRAY
jgi:hypothetical protein